MGQAKEGPAVLGQARKIIAVNLFRFREAAGLHQVRSQRMPHRQNPSGWLIVTKRVFRVYRSAQFGQALVELAVSNQDLAFEHRSRNPEHSLARGVAKG